MAIPASTWKCRRAQDAVFQEKILGGALAGEPSPAKRAHRPTGGHRLRTPEIRVQVSVDPLNTVLWPSGKGGSLTKSGSAVRVRPGLLGSVGNRQTAVGSGTDPKGWSQGCCGFESHLGHLHKYVLVEQPGVLATPSTWRSRVQIPSRAPSWHGTPSRQSGQAQTLVLVGSTPSRATRINASAGHWRAQVAVTHPPRGCAGSTPARRTDNMVRSSNGSGYETLILVIRVRLPYGLLTAKWWNW